MNNQNEKPSILLVDDEENVLSAYKRSLRQQFTVLTANGGEQALEILHSQHDIPVVVSDMRMPKMDGLQLLEHIKHDFPNVVRVMLTGNADQQTAIEAINRGEIFRFHTKPCSPEDLAHTILEGIELHRLKLVEKDMLKNTLRGAIQALTEVLSLANPGAFGRTMRITSMTTAIAKSIGMKDVWFLESLALLSQIGCVILPEEILEKVYRGSPLNEEQKQLFEMHPSMGSDIIGKIPRMESMGEAILYQMKGYDGSGTPLDSVKGTDIPVGGRILKIVIDFDDLIVAGKNEQQAYDFLKTQQHLYDPRAMVSLRNVLSAHEDIEIHKITVNQLKVGMRIVQNIKTNSGTLIINKGHEVTSTLLDRITVFSRQNGIQEPVYVTLPEIS